MGRLAYDLRQHFPADQVFQDIASIDPGLDFGEALQQGLDACAAVLVVIDPKWLTVSDRQGRRRLDVPEDWVRHEVAESLRRTDVRVFPVLLDTEMPGAEDLPEPLRPLTRRQAFRLTAHHWPHDVTQLIAYLKRVPGLSGAGAREAGEATARSPTEQEAQRVEAGERLANGEAQRVETAEEARRKSESEGRRTSEDVRRGAAEEAAPRGAQPPQARAHRLESCCRDRQHHRGRRARGVLRDRKKPACAASVRDAAGFQPAGGPSASTEHWGAGFNVRATREGERGRAARQGVPRLRSVPQMVTVPRAVFMMGSRKAWATTTNGPVTTLHSRALLRSASMRSLSTSGMLA